MKKILIVDDTDSNRIILKSVVGDMGYEILEAVNGQNGIEVFERETGIDCIITDRCMPKLNGVEMITHIRKLQPKIPIIAYSANLTMGSLSDFIDSGISGFLEYPFNIHEVAHQINRFVHPND